MKRAWCCRDLEGEFTEKVYLFVGENPPAMSDDGEWSDPEDDGIFWSEEDFNTDFGSLFGDVKFPELNKGEYIEMELTCKLEVK